MTDEQYRYWVNEVEAAVKAHLDGRIPKATIDCLVLKSGEPTAHTLSSRISTDYDRISVHQKSAAQNHVDLSEAGTYMERLE